MLWQWQFQKQDKTLADVDLSADGMNGRVGKTNLFSHEAPAQSPSHLSSSKGYGSEEVASLCSVASRPCQR